MTSALFDNPAATSRLPISAGALSLINDCVGAKAGERLLVVEEPRGTGFYDDEAPVRAAAAARALGLTVYTTEAPVGIFDQEDLQSFMKSLPGFDHVVFFARVGDQIRFQNNKNFPPVTMCYTLGCDMLDSTFGTACHHGLCEIKKSVDDTIANAEWIEVTCPLGTRYSGRPPKAAPAALDVTIKRFPMLVPSPVDAVGFSGQVVLSRFLVGTGSRYYEPYCLDLNSKVTAMVENNELKELIGDNSEVERIRAHYQSVSSKFDIDPWFVHSWHAGIHPGCRYSRNASDDILRWSSSAFGNPRLLHFHTCGNYAPGEISWNIVDPTITVDGKAIWENGRLHPQRLNDFDELACKHQHLIDLYDSPQQEIGLA